MSIETIVLTGVAVAVAVFPKLGSILRFLPLPKPPQGPNKVAVSYQDAMLALATVRSRLVGTGGPSTEAAKAIATITQDLVTGSDK